MGSVNLIRTIVRENQTTAGDGGGVYAALDASIASSLISKNSTTARGGGVGAGRNISLLDSDVAENRAGVDESGFGGGGLFAVGSVIVSRSSVRQNYAEGSGGGIRGVECHRDRVDGERQCHRGLQRFGGRDFRRGRHDHR